MPSLPSFNDWISTLNKVEKHNYLGLGKNSPMSRIFPLKKNVPVYPISALKKSDASLAYEQAMSFDPWAKAPSIYINFIEKDHYFYPEKKSKKISTESVNLYYYKLLRELIQNSNHECFQKQNIPAISIDGNWIKFLEPSQIIKLLNTIHEYYSLSNDVEISTSLPFYSLHHDQCQALYDAGFNAITLTSTTLNQKEITARGLKITPHKFLDLIDKIKYDGHMSLCLQMYYGYVYQSLSSWEKELILVRNSKVDSVDFKQIPFASFQHPHKPGGDKQFMMHEITEEIFDRTHIQRIFNNTYSLNGMYRHIFANHSLEHKPVFSYGINACSTFGPFHWVNYSKLRYYMEYTNETTKPIESSYELGLNYKLFNDIIRQFKRSYFDLYDIQQCHEIDMLKFLFPLFKEWENLELIKFKKDYLELTTAGRYWWVNLAQTLINMFNQVL